MLVNRYRQAEDYFFSAISSQFPAETMIKLNNGALNEWMMPLIGAFESSFENSVMYMTAHKNALEKKLIFIISACTAKKNPSHR